MSEIDYAALEALEKAATPGPWDTNRRLEIGPRSTADDQSEGMMLPRAYAEGIDDAAFIVAIRNVAPALIAKAKEADEYEKHLVALKTLVDIASYEHDRVCSLLAKADEKLEPFANTSDFRGLSLTCTQADIRAARSIRDEIKDALQETTEG